MRGSVRRLAFLAIALAGRFAGADEPPKPQPPVPAPARRPAPPPTPERDADAVLAALQAKDDAALKALAARDIVDPWLVADELMRRGAFDAAAAFAKAAPSPDVEALPAHVEARRARGPEVADRELLAAMNAAMASADPQKVLEGTDALAPEVDTPVRVRLLHIRGRALQAVGRLRDSAVASRGAAEAAITLGWLRRGALIYDLAVTSALDASENAQALAMLDVCFPLNERRGDKLYAARALTQIGIVQARQGDAKRAVATYDQALARFEAIQNAAGIAWVLRNAALLYGHVGDHRKELAARERLQPLLEALGDRGGAAENMNSMGTALESLGEYARALTKLEDALARVQALGEKAGEAGCLVNLGNTCRGLGDRARALTYLERGRALAEEVGHRLWLRNALVGIGLVHMDSGEHAKAIATYQQLLALQERWGDKAGAAETLARVGYAYTGRGDFTKAVASYQQALARQEAMGNRAAAAVTLQQLGLAYLALGDLARGLTAEEEAVARFQANGDKGGESGCLVNLGNAYRDLGDPESARTYYRRGLAIAEEIGQREWRHNALFGIAGTYLDTGEPARALAAFEQVLAEGKDPRPSAEDPRLLRNIGSAHNALKDPAKALEFHRRALKASEEAGDAWMIALTCGDIGCDLANLKEEEAALQSFERSERVARSRRLAGLLVGTLTNLVTFYVERNETALALGTAKTALREMENVVGGLGEEQGATARGQHTQLFAYGTLAAVREKDPAAALTFLESGRAGALLDDLDRREALRWKAEALSPELQRLDLDAQARERAARDAYEQVARGDDLGAQRAAGRALDEAAQGVREVAGRIQRELKQQAEFFYPRARTIEEIRSVLRAEQALVIYGLCDEEALALVLRPDGARIVELGKVADVVAACEALDAKDPGVDPEPALDALRKRLVEPLALEEGVKQVLVSPEGPLCYLPFALLFRQTVVLTPSGTTHVLLLDEDGERGRGILALGDPDYAGVSAGAQAIYQRGHPLTSLPATRMEAASIGTRTLLGAEASEGRLQEVLGTSPRWRAVHFACHGLVNIDKPMLSSLALTRAGDADGFLTALEVLRTKIPADLVVLSACETATGKIVNGEGIVGLTRAFMFAGSPRVICSLWKVDDEATRALMAKFYELWNPKDGEPGLPTAEALRRAQEFVRSQEKWKHPYYWAAWVLWGLPS